ACWRRPPMRPPYGVRCRCPPDLVGRDALHPFCPPRGSAHDEPM
ncbi:MAG: hypothetical protein AVDCRST_MAG32-2603, partial [uncultured Nocardioides sp.]